MIWFVIALGRREGLRAGVLEGWRTGGLEDWRIGGLEDWRTGGQEEYVCSYSELRKSWVFIWSNAKEIREPSILH